MNEMTQESEINPSTDPLKSHPDIPRGCDQGFYFNRYISQVYAQKGGWFTYDPSQSNVLTRITGGHAPFPIERPESGIVLLKGVAKKYSIQAYSFGSTFNTLEISVLENDDIKITIKNGGNITNGTIYVSFERL